MISPVTLDLMQECPRCFWLDMVEDIKRPKGYFPTAPIGLKWQLARHFDRYRKNEELPPSLSELEDEGFSLYREEDLLRSWRHNSSGIKIKDEDSGLILKATLDDVLIDIDGNMIPMRSKSRGFALKGDIDQYKRHSQTYMDMYNYLLRENGYPTDDYGFLLFFYPVNISKQGNSMRFKTQLERLDSDAGRAMDLIEEAKEIMALEDAPDSGEDCGYCKYFSERS